VITTDEVAGWQEGISTKGCFQHQPLPARISGDEMAVADLIETSAGKVFRNQTPLSHSL